MPGFGMPRQRRRNGASLDKLFVTVDVWTFQKNVQIINRRSSAVIFQRVSLPGGQKNPGYGRKPDRFAAPR